MTGRFESMLTFASQGFWRASWQASILAVVVLLLQFALGPRLGARGRYALWGIVFLRLLLPALPGSRFSFYGFLERSPAARQQAVTSTLATSVVTEQNGITNLTQPARFTAMPSHARAWSTSQYLAIGWLLGVIALGIRVAISCLNVRRAIGAMQAVTDPSLLEIRRECTVALRLRRSPPMLTGDAIRTPAVVGAIRPKLLLPASVLQHCDRTEIRLILLHELAHLRRHDLAANWLIVLATILHWFNPIIWLAAARMRSDRELACDELVLTRSDGREARAYGMTLVKLMEILSPAPRDRQLVGILESTVPMQRRVRMIAKFSPPSSGRWIWTTGLLLLLGCAALTDAAHGDPKATKTAGPATRPSGSSEAMVQFTPQTEAELQAQLHHLLPEVKFDAIPFSDVMDYLREQGGLNLFVNWRALEAAGIDRAAPITLWLKRVTIEQALDHVLTDAGGGTVKLDYTIAKGAITVSTDEDLSRDVQTVFYDVQDLLVSPQGQTLDGAEAQRKLEELKKVIMGTIAPESWRDAGGTVGGVDIFNTKLIITTTPKLQQQIEFLLARLREKPSTQPRPLKP